MDARKRGLVVAGVGVLVVMAVAAGVVCRQGGRTLTAQELPCVGAWGFVSPESPTTFQVYELRADGRAIEEHYYLTSVSPTIPSLVMEGVWQVDGDRLVLDSPEGVAGFLTEASRLTREWTGQDQYPFPMLRRSFVLKSADADRLTCEVSLSDGHGGYAQAPLLMERFRGLP